MKAEKFLEHSIGFDEYITGNRFIDICQENSISFCKTDFLHTLSNTNQNVLVTHNSDYHICKNRFNIGPKHTKWFCQNKDYDVDSLIPIPIGLQNMKLRLGEAASGGKYSSEIRGAHANSLLLDKVNNFEIEKEKLVYMNFSINTYPFERQAVWNYFKNESWITKTKNISIEQYYFDLAEHKFIISPRGNGVDCHRTWEALYLRTIPIVKRSVHMKEFEELPIFFVDNWEEVCYTRLVEFYNKVENTLYNLDKMKISYWRNRIKNEH